MTLIDPATIAALKGRRAAGTLNVAHTPTSLEMTAAFARSARYLERQLLAAGQQEGGMAAQIVLRSVRLHCEAATAFATQGSDLTGRIRRDTDRLVTDIWDGYLKSLAAGIKEGNIELCRQLDAANTRIAELEAELQRRAEEPMPKPARTIDTRPVMPPHLAALSFVAFLRSRGQEAKFENGKARHTLTDPEHDQLNAEWRQAIPDAAAALAQLRAIVGPILRGEAQSAA